MKHDSHDLSERVALFRHCLIAQLLPEDLTARQRQQTIERIFTADHQIPGTQRTRVAESLRDWLRDYRSGGFDALKPKRRIDAGHPRALDPALVERLLQVKEAEPDRSIRRIIETVRKEGVLLGFSGGEHTTWRKAASDAGCSDIKKFGVRLRAGGLAGAPGNG